MRTTLEKNPNQTIAAAERAVAPADIIGGMLVEAGLMSADQLRRVRRIQERVPTPTSLVAIIEELRLGARDQVREALKSRKRRIPVRLTDLLIELGYIRDSDMKLALSIQKERPAQKIGSILVETRALTEERLVEILAIQLGIERLDLRSCMLDPQIWQDLKWLRANDLIPVERRGTSVVVAFADPLNRKQVEAAQKAFGRDLIVGIAGRTEIQDAIDHQNQQKPRAFAFGENVVVETVNQILRAAVNSNTSDIHIEPQKNNLHVRFRQDGVLVKYQTFPLEAAPALTSRLKVMAKMDIAEKRRHQDGRLLFEDGGIGVDLRISTYASIHGETIVLRLLNTRSQLLDIKQLGMGPRMLQNYLESALDVPSGVVIVTGPTGSGKTTTLYSSVHYLNHPHTSIITAEDPVEYVVEGVTQCSINPRIGLTYEDTLKHIVRQDPDVIVIGEVRDTFSAETAIQAALTGHKVLTTFHTEDSIGGLVRLLNMNIEAFLVSSTVVSVLAQRLVRKVCPYCAEDEPVGVHQIARLGYATRDLQDLRFKIGRGCNDCHFLGYKGRIAVFELLTLNDQVKDAVLSRKSSYEIRRMSMETTGLVTLLEDALYKAMQGLTTFDEIMRQVPRLDRPRPISEIRRLLGEIQ
jgi:type IV pilus assembly protein PilB